MANTIVVFLALAIFVAHCHVLKDKEPEHKNREKRSCYVCDDDGHGRQLPPASPSGFPPPPPPFFHKWRWNGPGRGGYGSQQGAFSAAASSAGTRAGGQESGYFGGGSTSGQRFEGQQETQTKDFGAGAGAQSNFEGSLSSSRAFGSGYPGNEQQQSQSACSGFGQVYGHRHHHGPVRYPESESLRGDNEQETLQGKTDNGQWQVAESASKSKSDGFEVSKGSAGSSQEALSGALQLASQGLQTPHQTASSGCSTCGKSNSAISNAKSDSGNAIAVSIGR